MPFTLSIGPTKTIGKDADSISREGGRLLATVNEPRRCCFYCFNKKNWCLMTATTQPFVIPLARTIPNRPCYNPTLPPWHCCLLLFVDAASVPPIEDVPTPTTTAAVIPSPTASSLPRKAPIPSRAAPHRAKASAPAKVDVVVLHRDDRKSLLQSSLSTPDKCIETM